MLEIGFVKIDRKITQWRWYHDANTFRVFFHLIVTANYEDKDFEKITIKRGERVISYPKLAAELGLSEQNIRTAIKHLKETGEVTVKSHSKFSVVTVNNYNQYQSANSQLTVNQQADNSQLTGNQQADNSQLTGNQQASNNNERKIKKDKESKKLRKQENSMSDKSDRTRPKYLEEYEKIISYLNQKAGTNYKTSTKETQRLINARLAEGYNPENFFDVIDKKCAEWLGTDMAKYLRPATLFGNKFEGYLNQKTTSQKTGASDGFDADKYSAFMNDFD